MFVHINRILYKTKPSEVSNVSDDTDFTPFMLQRWCSMYSSDIANLLNETSNRHWPALNTKEEWFNYLDAIIPQCKFKSYKYIKKKKDSESKAKDKESAAKVAAALEISSREVNQYIQQFNLQIPNEQKR